LDKKGILAERLIREKEIWFFKRGFFENNQYVNRGLTYWLKIRLF